MKKIIITTALVACAAVVTAQTVTSANIVGYYKLGTPAANQFSIVSLTQLLEGTNAVVDIQDAIGNLDALTASSTWADADKLLVWANGYTEYGLFDDTGRTDEIFWMANGSTWDFPDFITPVPAVRDLSRGASVWIKGGGATVAADLLVSGEVPLDASSPVDIGENFVLVSYPFSSAVNLKDLAVSNATASADWAVADKILLWNNGYTEYGLFDDAGRTDEIFWMAAGSSWDFPDFITPTKADVEVPLGTGFWFKSEDYPKTISFDTNY